MSELRLTVDEEAILHDAWIMLDPNTRISWRDYWLNGQIAKCQQEIEQDCKDCRSLELFIQQQDELSPMVDIRPKTGKVYKMVDQAKQNTCPMCGGRRELLDAKELTGASKIVPCPICNGSGEETRTIKDALEMEGWYEQ